METLLNLFFKYFNPKDPKAWGALFVIIAPLIVNYVPGGAILVEIIKANPETSLQVVMALAGLLGLWNQKKKAEANKSVPEHPTTAAPHD